MTTGDQAPSVLGSRQTRCLILLTVPPLLLASTYVVFQFGSGFLGPRWGYLTGFLFYWLFWCLLLPLLLLGAEGVSNLFRSVPHPLGRSAWLGAAALLLPLILGFGYAFPQALTEATALVVVLSVTIAIVNGTMEELLWRGTYSATFRGSRVLGWLYPSVGFGLWHFAPQSVFPNPAPGGSVSLVAVAIVIGLLWGHVARTSGSIRWTAVSHILFNVSGLGAHLYLS